jgi:hypothetical protein
MAAVVNSADAEGDAAVFTGDLRRESGEQWQKNIVG